MILGLRARPVAAPLRCSGGRRETRLRSVLSQCRGVVGERRPHVEQQIGEDKERPEAAGELGDFVGDLTVADGASVEVTGEWPVWSDFNQMNEEALHKAELLSGLPTLIMLFIAFGALIAAGLRAYGFDEEALRIAAAQPIDLVSMDFNMEGLNGLDTALALRAHRPDLPIALMTANVQSVVQQRARDAGLLFLPKPITADSVHQMAALLDSRQGASRC